MYFSGMTITGGITISPAAATNDPYFMYNAMLLPGNGTNNAQNNTILDSSTNNFTMTRNGNTTQGTFSPYGGYWSNYFDGNGDYLNIASNSAFNLTGDFTIEFWFCDNGSSLSYPTIIGNVTGWSAGSFSIRYNNTGSANKVSVHWNGATPSDPFITSTNTFSSGVWNHVAFTRSGTTCTLWVNGTSQGTGTFSTALNLSYGGMNIGWSAWDTTQGYFKGFVSNVRVNNTTAIYTSTFTPSTAPLTAIAGTVLLTCQSNRFIDNSTNNFALTPNGDVNVQKVSPFATSTEYSTTTIGGSGYFDGSGDNTVTASTTAFNLSTNPFSIEMWFYWTGGNTGGYSGLCGSATDYKIAMSIYNGKIMYGASSNGTNWNILSAEGSVGSNTVRANQWNHIVLCRTGNTISAFLNGSRDITVSTSSAIVSRTEGYTVGAWYSTLYYFSGYISDFRFVVGSNPYDATALTITVPTAPLTAVTGTNLLCNYTNAGVIDNTMINNIETVGDAKISTTQSKFGGSSIYFDGTGDYLYSKWSPNLELSRGDFTIEFWVYPTGGNSMFCWSADYHYGMTYNYGGASSNKLGVWASSNGTTWDMFNADPGGNGISSGALTPNTWTHVALVRNGSSWVLYLNGISSWTGTSSATIVSRTTDIFRVAGPWPGAGPAALTGYIDDFRITRGYARYTSNFTPPTSAFPLY